ncbi:MAG: pyruvate kinase [Algoriphagus sp.]|uniref:pyruvate kinase n=1 Tax=Algoriphagus sp. TaxID=1872435 RepID=UPI0027301B92|nr:pyruvate kinase [Algoriphagus sp.]MDP2041594.1 pyruvate kinase [Algoriphagus sp.]MDP3472549.1 pyruvate kinase [Algoriphagus sp.]
MQLSSLRQSMNRVEEEFAGLLADIPPHNRISAINFLKYLILRKTDVRELQIMLHENGLSSLASCESHTQRQIEMTLQHLGEKFEKLDSCTTDFGSKKIEESSHQLFGPKPENWPASIMVTFDSAFLAEKDLIPKLLKKGMSTARINCAHDDESVWQEMVDKIRLASKITGLPCKIHVDLGGPKIRTKLLTKGKDKGRVEIKIGETIWLSDSAKGFKSKEIVISPNESGVIAGLKIGDRVFIDDGLILGLVQKVDKDKALLKIERISSKKPFIKAEKGINFPDCSLQISSLTDFDKKCLPFVCANADTVGFSFVRSSRDIADLRAALKEIVAEIPFMILKIETHEAVKNLPSLLLEGMKDADFGVMIARGDLAVEIGFERLVEIQDEILWLCEAAHVPVIWATQVLENLHKSGVATRAEVTDAGHASRAECIMINKGKHTLEVLKTLRDISQRSAALRIKNRLVFRPLKIAADFFGEKF